MDRVDSVSQDLAQKPDKNEVRLKSENISLNDADSELLAAIEGGAETTFNLLSTPREHSVGAKETTFARKGKNKWDGTFVEGLVIQGSPLTEASIVESVDGVMAYVEVEPNQTYTVWTSRDTNRFRIAGYDRIPKVGDIDLRYIYSGDGAVSHTLTTLSNETYLIIYLSNANEYPAQLQVEVGEIKTNYEEPHQVKIEFSEKSIPKGALTNEVFNGLSGENFADKSIPPEKLTFVKPGKNIWNGEYIQGHSLIGSTDADGYLSTSASETLIVIQKLDPGKTYTVSKVFESTSRFKAGTFTEYPNSGDYVSRFVQPTNNIASFTVTMDPDENYLVIFVSYQEGYKEPEKFMIEEGNAQTNYVSINAVDIELSNIDTAPKTATTINKISISHVISKNYDTNLAYISPHTNDINFLYGIYDDLVTSYPEYVTRTLLGNEPTGLPIYQYDFKPPTLSLAYGVAMEYPKIIYNSAIHGMEKHAAVGAAKVFQAICNNWRENEVLEMLRWNIHFIVTPILNPWGYNANTRKNSNGIDLNRNFSHGWTKGDDPASFDYSGTTPASEIETQLMEQLIVDNKDALFFVDHHNSGGWEPQGHVIWSGSPDAEVRKMLNGFNHLMSSQAKKKFDYLPENELLEYLSSATQGGLARFAQVEGINSTLLETAVQFNVDADTQLFNENAAGNLLLSIVKNYS